MRENLTNTFEIGEIILGRIGTWFPSLARVKSCVKNPEPRRLSSSSSKRPEKNKFKKRTTQKTEVLRFFA
jgi:hypothetical protein